ncbi:hypothetical protein [uncultured Shewanella sp.]|uniref:hypothetical protein n=1 Tax=Shewanella atlantica TaxID=271099 RepID=UPI0026070EBC|nr:hypothetical protein [uncultured Shewanella sp.]
MPSRLVKLAAICFTLLAIGCGIGISAYLNSEQGENHKQLLPLVIGSWVRIPGFCEGKTVYLEQMDIMNKQSLKIKGETLEIVNFQLSNTSPVQLVCDPIGEVELFAQTSFIADKFSRFYVGKAAGFTVMKEVSPAGELWFKLDSRLQKKLQAMNKVNNRARI